jgi:hypothetical protein
MWYSWIWGSGHYYRTFPSLNIVTSFSQFFSQNMSKRSVSDIKQPFKRCKTSKRSEEEDEYRKPLFGNKIDKSASDLWQEAKEIKVVKNKWSKASLIKFSRLLHHCRSIQYDGRGDCGNLRELLHSFREFIEDKPQYATICDPFYLFLDWSNVPGGPVPQKAWTLPLSCQGNLINVANFQHCYEVPSSRQHLVACGALVSQFHGLRVIPVTHAVPIEVEFR